MVAKNIFEDWGKLGKNHTVEMKEERFNVKIFMKKIFRQKTDKKLMSGEKSKSGNSTKLSEKNVSDSKKSSEYEEESHTELMDDEKVNEKLFFCIFNRVIYEFSFGV